MASARNFPLQTIPPNLISLRDYEMMARETLSEGVMAYLDGGAADEVTLRDNCAAFARVKILPRIFADVQQGNTQMQMLGVTYAHPLFVAPTALQRVFHPEGELATVAGAAAVQTPMVVSTQASCLLEQIATQSHTPLWFQLYIQPDRAFTLDMVARAESAGYKALMVTGDAPLTGLRNREQRAGFFFPNEIQAVNLRGIKNPPPGTQVFGNAWLRAAPSWRELEWLQAHTKLPIWVKGIMHEEDAKEALAYGVAGIVISNHGGRTLDTAPATLDVLPRIHDIVGGEIPLLFDGGIRRGTDVFKALALGATGVMIGRPVLHGLALAGAVGVAHVLKILLNELELCMVQTGCATLASVTREKLWKIS